MKGRQHLTPRGDGGHPGLLDTASVLQRSVVHRQVQCQQNTFQCGGEARKTSRAHLWGHGKGQHPPELTWGDLADSSRVPAIALVTVGRLDKNSAVTEALCKDLPSDVVEPYTSPCGGQRYWVRETNPQGN